MTMRCNEITPCSALRPFIYRYWCWTEEPSAPRRLPGTGHELMLHFGTPWRARALDQELLLPRAYVVTPRSKSWQNAAHGAVGFFAVRFRAGAFRHFCDESIALFADQIGEASQIWKAGRTAWLQQALEARDLPERVAAVEGGLLALLDRYRKQDDWLDEAVRRIYAGTPLGMLPSVVFSSERTLLRKFKEGVGVTPKVFQRLARFERTLRSLMLGRTHSYLPLALAGGYYDQAHFSKEFKRLVGETPQAYLMPKNFQAHFYFERRKAGV